METDKWIQVKYSHNFNTAMFFWSVSVSRNGSRPTVFKFVCVLLPPNSQSLRGDSNAHFSWYQ